MLISKIRRAFILSLWVIAPWIIGIIFQQAMFGLLMSFGGYLLVVSFPKLPQKSHYLFYYKVLALFLSLQVSALVSPLAVCYFFSFQQLLRTFKAIQSYERPIYDYLSH
ncbi:hypothetical protein AB6G19_09170 [Providencia manganoxydans]